MLDDWTILFLANYVYTYSLYAQTVIFSYWSAVTVHLNVVLVYQTQSRCLPCADSGAVRIDPLRFLAGCRTR